MKSVLDIFFFLAGLVWTFYVLRRDSPYLTFRDLLNDCFRKIGQLLIGIGALTICQFLLRSLLGS